MRHNPHRRLIVLLLLALLVPCAVLAALSIRIVRQERELAAKRLADERQTLTAQVRQELLNRLDRIKLQAQNALAAQPASQFAHPAVVLAARIAKGRPVLPWEEASSAQEFHKAISAPDFARKIQEGEQQEFKERQSEGAPDSYLEALKLARHPV